MRKSVHTMDAYHSTVLERDNQVLIKNLKEKVQISWKIQSLADDAKAYHSYCNYVHIHRVFGEESRSG